MLYIYTHEKVYHAFANWMMRPTKRNPCAPQTPHPSFILKSKKKTLLSKPEITCGSVVAHCFTKQIAISRKYFTDALDAEFLVLFAQTIRFGRSTSVNELEGSPLSQNTCQDQVGAFFPNKFVPAVGISAQDLIFTVNEKHCFTGKLFSLKTWSEHDLGLV